MLAAGINIVLVSKRLGHSSVAITWDTYSHLLGGVGREATERAWALIPRGAPQAPLQDREQSVSNAAAGGGSEATPIGNVAGERPLTEPPWGVEPQTYALRVRRSNRLS